MEISRSPFNTIAACIAIALFVIVPVCAYSGDAVMWYSSGIEEMNSRNYAGAIEAFDKAITLEPDYFEAWDGKADALNREGKYQEALGVSDQVLKINPHDAKGWINRGYILYNLGRYEEELTAYEKAIEIDPQNTDAWFNRGYALAAMHRYDEAIRAFDRVAELDPGYANLQANKRIAEKNRDEATPFFVKYAPVIVISLVLVTGIVIVLSRQKIKK